ncbi:protein trichome birefringence-like 43 [Pyrus ussuriensis x Pyrus communis]|uniref:Protein trichome birefringence-like 43 n=1 Tax=Pyrus ussuriensis x Pyrus communis TaxID=2448454 RepID=A0A5N5GBX2_9ROSA|nr:protein trichome birefringence-like 43 [Pyrus ussuriensis x Pyrus communis]
MGTSISATVVAALVFCLFYQIQGKYAFGGGDNINATKNVVRIGSCDIFRGKGVYDRSYPLYTSTEFRLLNETLHATYYYVCFIIICTCRIDYRSFLQRFRGKCVLFVGDSLSLNQWQSLACIIHKSLPEAKYNLVKIGSLSELKFPEYDVSIMLSHNAFLVDIVLEGSQHVQVLDSIQSGNFWRSFDVLVFDTWHWWLHTGRKQPYVRDYIIHTHTHTHTQIYIYTYILFWLHKLLEVVYTYIIQVHALHFILYDNHTHIQRHSIITSINNVDHHIINNTYYIPREWGDSKSENCLGQTQPLLGSQYPGGSHPAEFVLKKVLRNGHPSAYGFGCRRGTDGTHRCLPGVPDTWNQILLAGLFQS